ncbi:MAG: N-acetylmuramoyl-L-alanine amidase [Gaiellaceae bacterium]
MQKLAALAALLAALAVPTLAHAGDVTMRARDVPLGTRTLSAAAEPTSFNMLAAHWIGSGAVEYRTRGLRGGWRTWRTADSDDRSGSWHDGNLDWTGASSGVQWRTRGNVRRLRSYEVWSRVTAAPVRALANAGMPAMVTRQAWHADEEIVRAKPRFAPAIKLAIVHHTAGSNDYTRAQAAAIVRGIEVYHVKGNGWNDIGYNFLVDRFGTVYEGRGGGIDRNVIGAHAEGFNTGTVGVALVGNYTSATPPPAQQAALVHLLAWRLDVAHIDPLSTVVYTSGGNAKFRSGKLVTLRAISGHRDTGPSECPGNRAYALLPAVAKRVAATGLPKLYSPAIVGALGGPVTFRARLSSALPWTVTVKDSLGAVVAKGAGRGTLVSWTWSPAAAGKGAFNWTIAAPGIRVAAGTLGSGKAAPPPKLTLTGLAGSPAVIAPDGSGGGGGATATFTLDAPAQVTAQVLDASGVQRLQLLDEQRGAGENTLTWDASGLPDGRYSLAVSAVSGTRRAAASIPVFVDRTLTGLQSSVSAISPNGDGVDDNVAFSFVLTQDVPLRFEIEQGGAVVATLFQGQLGLGPHTVSWDGTAGGVLLPDGAYTVAVTFTDGLGEVELQLPLTIDTVAPVLGVLQPGTLRFTLSEPATVTVVLDQKTRIVRDEPAGPFVVPSAVAFAQFSATAQDAAGNVSAPVTG